MCSPELYVTLDARFLRPPLPTPIPRTLFRNQCSVSVIRMPSKVRHGRRRDDGIVIASQDQDRSLVLRWAVALFKRLSRPCVFYYKFDSDFGSGSRTIVSLRFVVALDGLRKATRPSLQAGQVIQVHPPTRPRPLDDFDTGADRMRLSPALWKNLCTS